MDTSENGLNFFTTILGIASIIVGLFFMLLIFLMQGTILVLLGIPFILFGITVLDKKIYGALLFLITPITILFSLNIIMMGIDKDIPKYYQTPIEVGLIIISPFWFVVLGGIYLWKKNRDKEISDKKKTKI